MIVHTLRHRRFRALSLRMIAKGSVVVCIAVVLGAGQLDFAHAESAPAAPASSALTMGGIMGILDIFNSRDPLRKIQPNQVYKTKYGNITGAEYERRVLEERVKAYEAAIRAGGTSRADWSTRKRAREVERKIQKDDAVTAAASEMMAGDWEERAAAETVLKAAQEEKSWWSGASRSTRSSFRKGMSTYRTPAREDGYQVSDNVDTVDVSPAPQTPSVPQAPPSVSSERRSSSPMPSLRTLNPTTVEPARVAPVAPSARMNLPAPPASPSVEVPEVKMLTTPKPKIPAPEPKPMIPPPDLKPRIPPPDLRPKVPVPLTKAEKKADQEAVSGNVHSEMTSKEKLRMAVFGEASEIVEPKGKPKAKE